MISKNKSNEKIQEKLDILEEHIQQLMNEIKKKNKLIQNYFMGLETGALVSEESDIHKVRWFLIFWSTIIGSLLVILQ